VVHLADNFKKGDLVFYIPLAKKRNREYNIGRVVEIDQKWVKIQPLFICDESKMVWELQGRIKKV